MADWGGAYARGRRKLVAQVYGTTCWLCGQPIDGLPSADHVIPRARGGTDDIDNLRPAHLRCNQRRGAGAVRRTPGVAPVTDW